jgi:hypothetical protein
LKLLNEALLPVVEDVVVAHPDKNMANATVKIKQITLFLFIMPLLNFSLNVTQHIIFYTN